MNVSEITFGVEIETTLPANSAVAVGPHGAGYDIPQLPGWKADGDPSIRANAGRRPCEFVSPVFRGADGLRQLLSDLAKIKAMGATVNASCGLHIHVGFNKTDTEASARLATLVANFEKAIFASTGTKNRERGRWCNGLQRYGAAGAALARSRSYRYHVANFSTAKPTVEFRAFSASLNPAKITAYLRLCIGMVEQAMTRARPVGWTRKAAIRGGEGQSEVRRCFYQLGWTKGRTDHTYGDLSGESLPTIDNSKRALMQMARKYDGQP